jgi:hypothetical protein
VHLVELVDKEILVQGATVVQRKKLRNQLLCLLLKVCSRNFLYYYFSFHFFSINIRHMLNGVSSSNIKNHWIDPMNSIAVVVFVDKKK